MENLASTVTGELKNLFSANKALEALSPQKALQEYENLILLSTQERDFAIQIDSQISIAKLYRKQGLFYEALKHAGAALQLIYHHFPEDNLRLALCCKELGVVYADGLKKYSIALDYFLKAIKCDVPELNAALYNNIGSLYKDSKQYTKAITYLEEGRNMAIIEKDKNIQVFILENLGRVHMALNQNEVAVATLQEALEVANEVVKVDQSVHYIRGYVLNALAETYLKIQREDEAICMIEEALQVAQLKNHQTVIIESLKNKGAYALQRGDVELFFESINKAIEYTEDENLAYEKDSCLELLKDFYWSQKQYKKACLIADQIIQHKTLAEKTHESISMRDVLEQRESEIITLEEKNRMIGQQKDELEQFAFIVAHDLKEPVRNIGSYGSLVKKRYLSEMDDEGKEFLNFIIKNATHMYKMLEDLLQYATLKSNDDSLKVIDPNIILKNITYRNSNKLVSTGTTIQYANLPLLKIRPIHLNILFDNLIKNAIKFRSSDRSLCIDITASEQDNYICFAVKDNAIGINPDYQSSIFQIFKRLDKINYSGTGIGLAICKKIVETYRGKIWVESAVDEGSTFFFTIRKNV